MIEHESVLDVYMVSMISHVFLRQRRASNAVRSAIIYGTVLRVWRMIWLNRITINDVDIKALGSHFRSRSSLTVYQSSMRYHLRVMRMVAKLILFML